MANQFKLINDVLDKLSNSKFININNDFKHSIKHTPLSSDNNKYIEIIEDNSNIGIKYTPTGHVYYIFKYQKSIDGKNKFCQSKISR